MIVPEGVDVDVDAEIGSAARSRSTATSRTATDVDLNRRIDGGEDVPQIDLELDLLVGHIEVQAGGSSMKTHPLNVSYLVVGLAFLGIAGSWALRETGVIGSAEVGWLLPLSLVVAGGIGLVAFMARPRRDERTDDSATRPA